MKSAIDSWSARTTYAILGVKRGAEEAMDQWWRRLHRVGHAALKSRDQSLSNMAERLIHRWGGHEARFPTSNWLVEVVAGGRSSATPTSGQESTRRDTQSSGGRISCGAGTAKGARRTPERTLGGGKTPKTVCLGGERDSWFNVN